MGEINYKPLDLVKAQIVTFAMETIYDLRDKDYIFNNLDDLAINGLKTISRTIYNKEKNGNGIQEISEELFHYEKVIATEEDYLQFLRQVKGSKFLPIKQRETLISSYQKFKPFIDRVINEINESDEYWNHPLFLGAGLSSLTFTFQQNEKGYVLRMPHPTNEVKKTYVEDYLEGVLRASHITKIEKIVAINYEDNIIVSEKIPGYEINHLPIEKIDQISSEHLQSLVHTLTKSNDSGVLIDTKPNNFIYDEQRGFGIVDIHYTDRKIPVDILLTKIISTLSHAGIDQINDQNYNNLYFYQNTVSNLLYKYKKVIVNYLGSESNDSIENYTQLKLKLLHDKYLKLNFMNKKN